MQKTASKHQTGFTLLEVVIALSLIVVLTTLLMTSFAPWVHFKQRLDTENRLKDLAQATKAYYKAKAFSIDNNDLDSTYLPGYGKLTGDPADPSQDLATNCPAALGGAFDSADLETTHILSNLTALQPFAASSVSQLAQDGTNNGICVFVSKRSAQAVTGATLFYHSVAFVSMGENGRLDAGTTFAKDPATGTWKLTLAGDDKGSFVDGFQIAVENYRITSERLQRFARAYESYFNTRYQSKMDRDIAVDYFYANDGGSNNGDPGNPSGSNPPASETIAATKISLAGLPWSPDSFDNVLATTINIKLGISESDSYDAWSRPILVDNRSGRVRSGENSGSRVMPPFTATFGAMMPGTAAVCTGSPEPVTTPDCPTFISATAVGSY